MVWEPVPDEHTHILTHTHRPTEFYDIRLSQNLLLNIVLSDHGSIRISYFVVRLFKSCKELSVKVNYMIYFFAEELINNNCDSMVFIEFYQCTNTVKSQVYLDVFLCKQTQRGLESS